MELEMFPYPHLSRAGIKKLIKKKIQLNVQIIIYICHGKDTKKDDRSHFSSMLRIHMVILIRFRNFEIGNILMEALSLRQTFQKGVLFIKECYL